MAKKSKPSTSRHLPVPVEMIERRIYLIRSHKVMLDSDLAKLYGVPTSALNQAVRRNLSRFPADFMFQLTKVELEDWKSQIVISNPPARICCAELWLALLSSTSRLSLPSFVSH